MHNHLSKKSEAVLFLLLSAASLLWSSMSYALDCTQLGSAGNTTVTSSASCAVASTWSTGSVTVNSGGSIQSSSAGGAALGTSQNRNLGNLINSGSILGSGSGTGGLWVNNSTISQFTNNGTLSATGNAITLTDYYGYLGWPQPTITTLSNTGTISTTTGSSATINNYGGSIGSFSNALGASITSSGGAAIDNYNYTRSANITSITNAGTISGYGYGIRNQSGALISTITNTGSIVATSSGSAYSISNSGTINTINNSQNNLTLTGNLPANYNAIFSSTSSYGKLIATSISGNLIFGVDSSSVLSAFTYTGVLSGLSSSNISNFSTISTTWTNFDSSYKWMLVQGSSSTTWDLAVSNRSSNINSGGVYQSSGLGTTVNPVFNGGTLQVSAAGTIANSFTITSSNGTIDQNGVSSNFSGVISDAVSGTPGKLFITNTGPAQQGKVTLSGLNTYTGGTEVQAGATLSIASASALGTGALSLVGSASVPATLETTGTMTINNSINVTGDPVFSIAPSTTTTISNPITGTGDVEVSGGGTLNLTSVNTYSGPTVVDSGSTLALSGNGSIATSSSVTNNGTLDLAGASSTVNLGVAYTQSSTGTTKLAASPGSFQKIVVSGAATLGGALSLSASAGNYSIGRYSLLSAGSLSGTYSSFSNNLASVTALGYSLSYDSSNVYLNLAPNSSATLQTIQQNGQALSSIYNLQAAALQAGLSYDCVKYDESNLCVSVGGRYTYAGTVPSGNAQAGLVIVGYRPSLSTRLGAFADQSASITTPNNISQTRTSPMWGLFGTWHMNKDHTGLSAQASAASSASELNISRNASTVSEMGQGKTQFNGQAYQVQSNYAQPITETTMLVPYLGLRYTRINQGAYIENTSAQVAYPVSYNAMTQNTFSVITGLGVQSYLAERLKGKAAVGLQQNLNYSIGNYAGTSSIPGMTAFSTSMPGNINTMTTASGGLYYDLRKNEQLGLTALWQQQPFVNTNTTTVLATYTMGF